MSVHYGRVPMDEFFKNRVEVADNEDIREILPQALRDLRIHFYADPPEIKPVPFKQQHECVLSEQSYASSPNEDEFFVSRIANHINCASGNEMIDSHIDKESKYIRVDHISMKNSANFIENEADQNSCPVSSHPTVPSKPLVYFLPVNYQKQNPWHRVVGFHVTVNELKTATYPVRTSIQKLRFAQARKPLSYFYSYFSVKFLDCGDKSGITVGLSRKHYPSKYPPGKAPGSIGYNSDFGSVSVSNSTVLNGPLFTKGDTIGCGIIYPSCYKCYADLSTEDDSDGMTDVVLTSLLNVNKKSMDFVRQVLNLNGGGSSSDEESENKATDQDVEDCDYYNENYVESRTQVEVYFTHNMQVIGKVSSYVPIGGFYPTVHALSSSAIKMSVDFNPPSS